MFSEKSYDQLCIEIFRCCNVTIIPKLNPKKTQKKKICYNDFALFICLEKKYFPYLLVNFE